MPKNRNKPEYTMKLSNGTILYINQIGDDMHGNNCFLITDTSGEYGSFVLTADCSPLEGETLTKPQQQLLTQIKKFIDEISGC
jgi:hypothetical protein